MTISEQQKFNAYGDSWLHNNSRETRLLHGINFARMSFLQNNHSLWIALKSGANVLDIGCGGGIFASCLERLGSNVTGIDFSESAISCAKSICNGNFIHVDDATQFCLSNLRSFDVVTIMDVIEHVNDYKHLLQSARQCLKPNGFLVVSSINKTISSLLLAKFAAEYILRVVPAGTHNWNSFVPPSEIALSIDNTTILDQSGVRYNPITQQFSLCKNTSMNYICILQAH